MFRVAVFACLAAACAGTQTPPPDAPPVTGAAPAPAAPEDPGRLLERAAEAHFQHQLEPEERLLEQVAAGEGPAHRRVTAHVRLANLAWRFRADPESGRAHLAHAEALAEEAPASDDLADARVDAAIERSRLETAAGEFAAGLEHAKRALAIVRTGRHRIRAAVAMGHAAVDPILMDFLDAASPPQRTPVREPDSRASGGAPVGPATAPVDTTWERATALYEAAEVLGPIVADEPGWLEASRLALVAALAAGDGPGALAAWRSYFHVPPGSAAPGLLASPGRRLERALRRWRRCASGAPADLIQGLADSRLFAEAALIAQACPGPGSRGRAVRDIVAYARYLRRVERLTDEYYRQVAIGQRDADGFRGRLVDEARALWPALSWPGPAPAPPATAEAAGEELDRRFGAVVNLGESAGVFDLHMGHRIVDERRTVVQYGHRAEVRFTSLDGMVSNGFQSWAWDGGSAHGGWASGASIVQVRPAYADEPLGQWRLLFDAEARARTDQEIEKQSQLDEERAAADPHAYLRGLQGRLKRAARAQLLAALEARGLKGPALRLAFFAEYLRADVEATIFAHEGRHAIDLGVLHVEGSAELEFRAKLSEIAFAPYPRLSLDGIIAENIGDQTGHGQANLRIVKGVVAWMAEHAGEIEGLDRARPLLPQLDRLSDDQLRAAFRSMDPLARAP